MKDLSAKISSGSVLLDEFLYGAKPVRRVVAGRRLQLCHLWSRRFVRRLTGFYYPAVFRLVSPGGPLGCNVAANRDRSCKGSAALALQVDYPLR